MISMVQTGALLNPNLTPQNTASADLVGLSTDDKPTGLSVGNGWSYLEMDTGKIFFYNAADSEWLEFAGSGGGGGQGGSNVLIVHLNSETNTLDKTWQEIHDAPLAVIVESSENNVYYNYISAINTDNMNFDISTFTDDMGSPLSYYFRTNSANGYPVLRQNDGN